MNETRGNGNLPDPAVPSVYGDDGVTIIGMIGVVRESSANRGATLSLFGGGINPGAEVPSGVDPDYILDFARHPRAGWFRHGAHRLFLVNPGRIRSGGLRRGAHRAVGILDRAPARLRRAHAGSKESGHPGPADQRTHRPAHHHRGQRHRAAAGWRLAGSRFTVPTHGRISGRNASHLDGDGAFRSRW